jgi:hypothetical protein
MVIKFLLLVTAILVFYAPGAAGQSFGFGCLGLVGGFGGYTYQRYQPTGLNEYINTFNELRSDSLISPMNGFGSTGGFRFGINFFRADIQGLILTTKGFYQRQIETHDAEVVSSAGTSNYNYELKMNYWGLGIDLGTSITRDVSWKVIDASLLFNNIRFTDNQNYPEGFSQIIEYRNESTLGYTIGTGFIVSILEGYISVEGLAGYTQFIVRSMKQTDGTALTINENSTEPMTNFIDNGGFIAVLQLNIGFPL